MNTTKRKKQRFAKDVRTRGNSGGQRRRGNSGGQKKKASSLDYNQLISKKQDNVEKSTFEPSVYFQDLDLDSQLKSNLRKKGYTTATEIQELSLEPLTEGKNLVGVANTGTGKTAAFLIPIIENLVAGDHSVKSLVIVPTRELAQQVELEFRSLTAGMGLYTTCLIGGTSVQRDKDKLKRTNHLIVGTPGRLMDMYNQGALKLSEFTVLVLDEFDRMLDMGFVNEIRKMVAVMKRRSQTMLFSATLDKTQKGIIQEIVPNALHLKVNSGQSAGETIEQHVVKIGADEDKFSMLLNLLGKREFEKVIIFAETKRLVDRISKKLDKNGISSVILHGNKSQNYRNRSIRAFKEGSSQILVATDVAARGIDVENVSHVINYQIPQTMESYLHRIGRTGRAGKSGTAYTFVD